VLGIEEGGYLVSFEVWAKSVRRRLEKGHPWRRWAPKERMKGKGVWNHVISKKKGSRRGGGVWITRMRLRVKSSSWQLHIYHGGGPITHERRGKKGFYYRGREKDRGRRSSRHGQKLRDHFITTVVSAAQRFFGNGGGKGLPRKKRVEAFSKELI